MKTMRMEDRVERDNSTFTVERLITPDSYAGHTQYYLSERGPETCEVSGYASSGYSTQTSAGVPEDIRQALACVETSDGTVGGRMAAEDRLLAAVQRILPQYAIR